MKIKDLKAITTTQIQICGHVLRIGHFYVKIQTKRLTLARIQGRRTSNKECSRRV